MRLHGQYRRGCKKFEFRSRFLFVVRLRTGMNQVQY